MSAPGHWSGQTLYSRRLAQGATPEIVVNGAGGAGGGTAPGPRVLPPAVLAVWLPWPAVSTPLGPLQRPFGSVLEQSRRESSLLGAPPTPWPQAASFA